MRAITIRVEDELLLAVKQKALVRGETVQDVGTRLFQAYADKVGADRGGNAGATAPVQPSTAAVTSVEGTNPPPLSSASARPRTRNLGGSCSREVYHRKGEFCKECGYGG